MSDIELVAAAKLGDQAAFTELHRRHIEDAQRLARKILHVEDVDDVCQDIFQKAFTRIDSFKGEAEFKTWLTSIAQRECIRINTDRMRPTRGSSYLDPYFDIDEEGKEQEIHHDPDWEEPFIEAERRVDLPKMLSSLDPILPPKTQRLVNTVVSGAAMQEAADELGVPLKTVETRFGRALRRIEKNILPK